MMNRKIPLRRCTGCNQMKEKNQLIRIVRDKEDHFSIDLTGKLNGRGAYICRSKDCLQQAIKKKGLERSFKCKIPEAVIGKLTEEMSQIE